MPHESESSDQTIDQRPSSDVEAIGAETLAAAMPIGPMPLPTLPGYDVLGELGRGGMGVVYRAYQPSLRRAVAIKMLLAGTLAGPEECTRFRTECEAAGGLQHPGIVRVHDVGTSEGRPYYTMDLVEGPSLAIRLREGPLPPAEAARLVAAAAEAIQHAHDHGILHRDLKPLNILLDREGRPLVADFGLAKRLDEAGQTRTGAAVGTPSYMAPEQAAGSKSLTPAADVYGLGAVLYECLTGRPPFRAATPVETVMQVLEHQPAPPRLLNPQLPRDLETICLKCLQKDPRQRYSSAAALAGDLHHYLAGEAISARSLNLVERVMGALEHSQHDAQFTELAPLFFWLALVMLVPEVLVTLTAWNEWPIVILPLTQGGRVAAFLLLLWHYRRGRLLPSSAAERQLGSVWLGYVLACIFLGVSNRLIISWAAAVEVRLYPSLSCLTALAFFATGSHYWGWCYAFGAAFLVLACLMGINLEFAALEFGALWAFVLILIGLRLRHLGAEAAARADHAR